MPLLALLAIWGAASRRRSRACCSKCWACWCCRGSGGASRRLLHGLLGWVARQGHEEAFVLASLCVVVARPPLARGGVPPPGARSGRDGAGRERRPSPHGKPPQTVSRCVVGGVLRDCRPAAGRSADSSAPLAVLAWLAVLVPVKIGFNTLALRATRLSALDPLAHGHSVGAWRRVRPAVVGHGLAAASDPRDRRTTHAGALVLGLALAPLLIRHHDVLARFFSRTGGIISHPG